MDYCSALVDAGFAPDYVLGLFPDDLSYLFDIYSIFDKPFLLSYLPVHSSTRVTALIYRDEWLDHGISHAGFYAYNKTIVGYGYVGCIWLTSELIYSIYEFFGDE